MPGKYAGFIMSDNDQKNFTQILDEFKSGIKSKAFKKQENYLKKNPNDNVARFNFAIMCNEINKHDLAIKNYKQVIRNDKSHWESRFNLYIILHCRLQFHRRCHQRYQWGCHRHPHLFWRCLRGSLPGGKMPIKG